MKKCKLCGNLIEPGLVFNPDENGDGYHQHCLMQIQLKLRDKRLFDKGFEAAKIKIFEKLEHTKPEMGTDGSKERYGFLQYLSDWNAIVEAVGDVEEITNRL